MNLIKIRFITQLTSVAILVTIGFTALGLKANSVNQPEKDLIPVPVVYQMANDLSLLNDTNEDQWDR